MKKSFSDGKSWWLIPVLMLICAAATTCAQDSQSPEGLAKAPDGQGPMIKFDLDARPFPEIPFPNDLATRVDKSSPTGLRLNISQNAPTRLEQDMRAKLNSLDGFGTFGAVTVSFTQPIDINVIIQRHQLNLDFTDDVVYIINLNRRSPNYGKAVPLDMGQGNFPLQLELNNNYFVNDPRANASNLLFETYNEDTNNNNVFDPYIDADTNFDNHFDLPNVFYNGAWRLNTSNTLSTYHDLVDFYERETNTLLMRPLLPLEEESEYAVVITKRLRGLPDANGVSWPVRSPFDYVNHTQQTVALKPLKTILRDYGLSFSDLAFAWKFTTGSMTRDLAAIRKGLYGHGSMAYLGKRFPARINGLIPLTSDNIGNPYQIDSVDFVEFLKLIFSAGLSDQFGIAPSDVPALIDSYKYVDYFVFGDFKSPDFLTDRDGLATPLYPADDDEIFDVDPLTGSAVVGDGGVSFVCTIPKPNYRLEQIQDNSAGGALDFRKIETRVNHRLAKVGTTSAAGRLDRDALALGTGALARRYQFRFTSDTAFDVTDADNIARGSGNTGSDFTTTDGWIIVPASAWNGTFTINDLAKIWIEPSIDPTAGPFSQTYTVTFTTGTNFTVTDESGAVQGSGTTTANFATGDGWLSIQSKAWSGTRAAGDTFLIDTVAMGPPYPTVIESHGSGLMKFEMIGFAGSLAKHGLAVCDNDAVGHGLALPANILNAFSQFKQTSCNPPADDDIAKLCNMIDPLITLFKGRGRDLNNDGVVDSGGDFWSADTFHTRDVVRQSVVDMMQMIRTFRAFDGTDQWNFDMNGNGIADDLAGDFNGDGVIDFGGPAGNYHTWAISLGGILSSILAGIEPAITSAAPVSAGAGLIDITARSTQSGVVEAVFLRLLGPIIVGVPSSGSVKLQWLIPDVNAKGYLDIGATSQIAAGDKIVVKNLVNGEERWAIVASNLSFRVNIPADAVGAVEKRTILGWGPNYVPGDTCRPACDVPDPIKLGDPIQITIYSGALGGVKQVINTWLQDTRWQGSWFVAGTPLVAPAAGFGLYRNTPDFRRFFSIAQFIMDPADPGTYAPHYFMPADPATAPNSFYSHLGPLDFSDYDPDVQPGANILLIPTIGDTNVPVNTGIALARNAGLIEFFNLDPVYGKTHNQLLLDTGVIEGVEKIQSYTIKVGTNTIRILYDIDDLDGGRSCNYTTYKNCKTTSKQEYICTLDGSTLPTKACADGYNAPTLNPPLRLTLPTTNGVSGVRIPYMTPTGSHGFNVPHPYKAFNIELYNINLIGRYFQTNGSVILDDTCMKNDACTHIPPAPK